MPAELIPVESNAELSEETKYKNDFRVKSGTKMIVTIGSNGERHYNFSKLSKNMQYSDDDVEFGGFYEDDGNGNISEKQVKPDEYLTDSEVYVINKYAYTFVSMGGLKTRYNYTERSELEPIYIVTSTDDIESVTLDRTEDWKGTNCEVYRVKPKGLKYEDIEYYIDTNTNLCKNIRAGGFNFDVKTIDTFEIPNWINNEDYNIDTDDYNPFSDYLFQASIMDIPITDETRGYNYEINMLLMSLKLSGASTEQIDKAIELFINYHKNMTDDTYNEFNNYVESIM